ncbi:PREDICTED: uncharacterized protein LOC108567011 [Nicrophorus vespilloides]|uniref:Uncharacterized protein LOC108567011 n=1 Tax=Nicrophorus vespilloides TaxID=110193 RepID=A0ABM1N780_NICVS|nr:PREDICTED: uncharacterized protein LOC108567011 [Nicrophorus vespilloides]
MIKRISQRKSKLVIKMSFTTQLQHRLVEPRLFYALLKFIMKKYERRWLINIISMILTMLILPFWWILLIVFKVYKESIRLILRLIYGKKFIRIIHGRDLPFAIETSTDISTITSVLLINSQENGEAFFNRISQFLFYIISSVPKTRCLRQNLLGFVCLMETEIRQEDFIKDMKLPEDNCDFIRFMDRFENEPMPFENRGLLQFYVGKKTVLSSKGYRCYPILMRYHHCLGDGVSIMNFIIAHLVGNPNSTVSVDSWRSKFKKIVKNFSVTSEVYDSRVVQKQRSDFLKKHTGKKYMLSFSEVEPRIMEKIKMIKNFKGVTFIAVLMAALGKAMQDYIRKNKMTDLERLMTTFTYYPESKFNYGNPDEFTNKVGLSTMKLPICVEGGWDERLKIINEEQNEMKSSMDENVYEWFTKVVLSLFPVPITKCLVPMFFNPLILSNLPGLKETCLIDGHKLEDYLLWPPNLHDLAISIATYSYCNRFYVNLKVDSGVIPDYDDAKTLMLEIVENINKMERLYLKAASNYTITHL